MVIIWTTDYSGLHQLHGLFDGDSSWLIWSHDFTGRVSMALTIWCSVLSSPFGWLTLSIINYFTCVAPHLNDCSGLHGFSVPYSSFDTRHSSFFTPDCKGSHYPLSIINYPLLYLPPSTIVRCFIHPMKPTTIEQQFIFIKTVEPQLYTVAINPSC